MTTPDSVPTPTTYLLQNVESRLNLVVQEMSMVQSRLDKYDAWIVRNRGWLITLVIALVGWAVTRERVHEMDWLLIVAGTVPAVFWFHEALLRWSYWYKYILRYRALRDTLNQSGEGAVDWSAFKHLDLAHSYARQERFRAKFKACILKAEPALFHASIILLVFLAGWFLGE